MDAWMHPCMHKLLHGCNNLQKISNNNQPTDKTERAMMDEEELAGNSGKGCGYVGSAVGGEHIAAFFDSCRVVGTYTPGKAIDENMAWSQQHPRGPWMYRCIHASMHSCTHASMHGCIDAWMHPCMDEWMHGCTHAWMHGCTHACINYCMVACFFGAWVHQGLKIDSNALLPSLLLLLGLQWG